MRHDRFTAQRHDGRARLPRLGDDGCNLRRRLAERIVGKVRVALRGPALRVAEQPTDDRKAQAAACSDGRERVPQIVNAGILAEAGALPNEVPDVPERGEVLAWLVAGEYPLALALAAQPIDQLDRRGAQRQLVRLSAAWCEWTA